MTKLTILQININDITNKFVELQNIVNKHCPGIIIVNEVNLRNPHKHNLDGYNKIHHTIHSRLWNLRVRA